MSSKKIPKKFIFNSNNKKSYRKASESQFKRDAVTLTDFLISFDGIVFLSNFVCFEAPSFWSCVIIYLEN